MWKYETKRKKNKFLRNTALSEGTGLKGVSGQQYTGNSSNDKIVLMMPSCGLS